MKPVLFHTLFLIAASFPAFALTPFTDDFDDNSISTAKWPLAFRENGGAGTFTETSQRLNYSTSGAAANDDYAILAAANNPASYNENWECVVDLSNSAAPTVVGQIATAGFEIFNSEDPNFGDNIFLEFYSSAYDQLPYRRGFASNFTTNGNDTPETDADTLGLGAISSGSIRISFDSLTKVFTTWYDSSGPSNGYQWVQLASYGIAGTGGTTGNTNWGMSNAGQFYVTIYGLSENMTVSSGSVWLENFNLSNTVSQSLISLERPAGATNTFQEGEIQQMDFAIPGNSKSSVFTIRNTGEANLTGLGITKDGANSSDFTITSPPTSPVPPSGTTSFTVRFAPTTVGQRSAALHITSNASNEPVFDLPLVGFGVGNLSLTGEDDFNDNSKDTGKWTGVDAIEGDASLTEINGRLEYIAPTAGEESSVYRTWIPNIGKDGEAFEVMMDVTDTISSSGPGVAAIGLVVTSLEDETDVVSIELGHGFIPVREEDANGFLGVLRTHENNGGEVLPFTHSASTTSTTGSIRISYDPALNVFTTYYDTSGSADGYQWQKYGSFGVSSAAAGSTRNALWSLSGGKGFRVSIAGASELTSVSSGQVFADNFKCATGSPGWRLANFGTTSVTADSADLADPDSDGIPNKMELATGGNPKVSETAPFVFSLDNSIPAYTYPKTGVGVAGGLQYIVEWSDTMNSNDWHTDGITETVVSANDAIQRCKAIIPAGSTGKRFVRLRIP